MNWGKGGWFCGVSFFGGSLGGGFVVVLLVLLLSGKLGLWFLGGFAVVSLSFSRQRERENEAVFDH